MKRIARFASLGAALLLGWLAGAGLEQVAGQADTTADSTEQQTTEWPQWGGDSQRNNVPVGEGIPIEWEVGDFDYRTGEWDSSTAENIKWVSRLGSQTYGNAVVTGGRVFVGTNNSGGWLPRYPAGIDLGCLIAFDAETGDFLWQHSSEKLPTGRVHDWPLQGICCAPLVENDRLWFVTSRGEVRCLDTEGFYDEQDDGPHQNGSLRIVDITPATVNAEKEEVLPEILEGLTEGEVVGALEEILKERGEPVAGDVSVKAINPGTGWTLDGNFDGTDRQLTAKLVGKVLSIFKERSLADKQEADVVWNYDMMEELGISQHNMCSCSVTSAGDVLFVNTSNGVDVEHNYIPAPEAPSFFAMDKNSGQVLWTDNSPGLNILHGQWSSPTYGMLSGKPQVIFAGGDGWVYSFDPRGTSDGKAKLWWKFDANPKTSKWELGGRGTRNNIIATPVIYEDRVYVAVGQDPEHGEGIGHLWCIDPSGSGDVSPELAFNSADPDKVIPHKRVQAVVPEEGDLARANPDSAVIWHYSGFDQNDDGEIEFEETMHRSCGTVAIRDDILYIADFSGLFHCLDAETGKVHWTYDMLSAAWGSPLIVEDKVYIGDEDGEVAIFKHSADPTVAMEDEEPAYGTRDMGNSVYSTPIVADNVLYISNRTHLFAIANENSSEKE